MHEYKYNWFNLETEYGRECAKEFADKVDKRFATFGKIITNIENTGLQNKAQIDSLELNSNFDRENGYSGKGFGVDPDF